MERSVKRGLLGVMVVTLACLLGSSSEAGINLDEYFYRGDVNADGGINISDPIALANYLYAGGNQPPCLESCDANNDGSVNGSDQIFLYNYLFSGGTSPYGTVPCY